MSVHPGDGSLDGMIVFEVEIEDPTVMRSRIIWPTAEGPWIEGGVDELVVHLIYAMWSAYNTAWALSLVISSRYADLGISVSESLSKLICTLGAVEISEIRMDKNALEELRNSRIEP
ncbi:hypothetical protein [Methanothrix sp.]|uniref:hypothetical protein n=1 Tax=Methanothrix sp. TaxID=90426 RepID=UPI0032AF3FAB